MRATQIQANAEAFILRSLHPNSIKVWLVNGETNVGYTLRWNGGTKELFDKCIYAIECIDPMTTTRLWV
jgi:hypothetical protein